MEAASRKSDGILVIKEEMRVQSNGCKEEIVLKIESTKAEMGEVIGENQRLKMHLNRIMKDYQTLQMQFSDIVGQEQEEEAKEEEPDLVSLRLGRTSSTSDETIKIEKPGKRKEGIDDQQELALGLGCNKFINQVSKSTDETSLVMKPSPENSSDEGRESSWPHNKVLKRSGDEVSEQNPVKRTRVSVRARCDTPTMNDGCQWRKYGQKIAKGNPCPRAYYRCSVAPSCPVRKQVQRCAGDMSILITTYEGIHNHPLPISATAMASATSAAASMLVSGSSTSSSSATTITTSPANHHLHGLNLYLSDNNSKPNHNFYLSSNPSIPSSHPTITLDLTSSTSSSYSSAHQFNKMSSNFLSNSNYNSSKNLNFSTFESSPISWNNGVLNFRGAQPDNKNQFGSLNLGGQAQENFYKSFMQKNNPNPNPNYQQPLAADGIAAATKAITSDPSFQSALAVALKSIIGTSGSVEGVGGGGSGSGGQTFPVGISNVLGGKEMLFKLLE